jgi:hypothetical protein
MRQQRLTKADKEYANSLNLEWLRMSNKVLRAFPNSPRQKELQKKLSTIPQFKAHIPFSGDVYDKAHWKSAMVSAERNKADASPDYLTHSTP